VVDQDVIVGAASVVSTGMGAARVAGGAADAVAGEEFGDRFATSAQDTEPPHKGGRELSEQLVCHRRARDGRGRG
jgi:hypothetical protein